MLLQALVSNASTGGEVREKRHPTIGVSLSGTGAVMV